MEDAEIQNSPVSGRQFLWYGNRIFSPKGSRDSITRLEKADIISGENVLMELFPPRAFRERKKAQGFPARARDFIVTNGIAGQRRGAEMNLPN